MYPELLRIGDFVVSSFGLMLVLAFVASYWELRRNLRFLGAGDEEDAASLVFAAGFFGIVGAKVYYAILYGDWQLLFDRSGLVWYGGFLLAVVALLVTVYRRKLPPWLTVDAMALGLALGYAVGRVGCFLVGDDYGHPTDLPWGIAFPEGAPPSTAGELRRFGVEVAASIPNDEVLKVHPTQLYETGAALGIWGIGRQLLKRRPPAGFTSMVVLGLLAIERFLVEILRAKDDRFWGPLTLAQAISLGLLAVAVVIAIARWRRGRALPAEA